MTIPRGEGFNSSYPEHPESAWLFYEGYKTPGQGKAIARPDFHTFTHVSPETLAKDKALLLKKKERPNLREQRATGSDAFAFENFLATEAQQHRWFGGELTPTTEYDDWICGADVVVEWPVKDNDPPLRLAIDFTSSKEIATFFKKSEKLRGNVLIKYFRSAVEKTEDGQQKEMRASMPIVLLGFDKEVFRYLAESKKSFGEDHPLRQLLLEQTSAQIDFQLSDLERTLQESQAGKRGKPLENILREDTKQKIADRHRDLVRLKVQVDEELVQARATPIDESLKKIIATSITHQVLAGRE